MNSPIYYIPEAKAQPNFHQNQPNYYQGQPQPNPYQNQPNYQQSQPNYQQNQPNYYQNQTQPSGQQNFSQQPNYQQKQYNTQPSQPNPQQYQPSYQQNQPIPQQTQPSTQQYQQTYSQQPNVYQNQPNYGQTQPNVQQNQQSTQQNQPTIPQGLSSFPLAESNYIQQPTSQQIQPTIQQSQQNVQQSQQNVQQYQPNVSQQPNPYQNQSTYPQTQPNIQQNQPTTQQNQPTVQQENLNITLDSFAPLQNTNTNMTPSQMIPNTNMGPSQMIPNTNMGPSQMLPNNNMGPSQMLPNNFNMAPSQMLPSNQANKFGISINITGENTYQEESIAYTLYNIQGYSQKGQFSTAKGYMDFVNLQFLLTAKFPGSKKYLEIPDKTLFLKLDNSQNETRKRGLENFLKFVACSQELFYSNDFQTFLATQAYPAKQQIEYLRKHNPFIMYNNPALQQDVNIDIVKEYEKTDGLLLKHREYVIQGSDQKGQFMVSRRYKDFVKIREILVAKFPGVPFLHLPSVTSQNTPERTQGLITFLRSIPKMPFAYQSTEYQIFIRYAEPDFKKKLKPFHRTQSVLKTILK